MQGDRPITVSELRKVLEFGQNTCNSLRLLGVSEQNHAYEAMWNVFNQLLSALPKDEPKEPLPFFHQGICKRCGGFKWLKDDTTMCADCMNEPEPPKLDAEKSDTIEISRRDAQYWFEREWDDRKAYCILWNEIKQALNR
jgi:hypothetical protein